MSDIMDMTVEMARDLHSVGAMSQETLDEILALAEEQRLEEEAAGEGTPTD